MKIYSENKKAFYDYEIIEKYEAGLVLTGQEVKSIKTGHINLAGSYVIMQDGVPVLVGAKVPPYQPKNAPMDYNPQQQRRLLLNKKEINYLAGRANEKGFSLIPLKVYENNGRIKLEFGVAPAQKKFQKKKKKKKRTEPRRNTRRIKK